VIDDVTQMAVDLPELATPLRAADGPRFVGGKAVNQGELQRLDALDQRLTRPVRITRSTRPVSGEAAERFLRGARIAARLDHPAIQGILGMGVDEAGHAYYVEPHRRAVGLAAWCDGAGGPPPSLGRRLDLFAAVCRAIAFAHRRGVVHGRLAADHVEVGEAGDVRIGGWDEAEVAAGALGPDLGPGRAANRPTAETDRQALTELLAVVLGRDRDAAPELAALVDTTAEPLDAGGLGRRIRDYLDGERNLALRARTARQLVSTARGALAMGGVDGRVRALALARQALALDPDNDDAAALTARLLVEVPEPLPPAGAAAVRHSDDQVMRQLGVGFIAAFGAFFVYVPLMLAQGVRSWPAFAALAVTTAAMLAWSIRYRLRGPYIVTWPPVIGSAIVLTLYARTYGPFINAPAQAALATMAIMFFPRRPAAAAIFALFAVPVVGNWLLEVAGILPTSAVVTDGRVVIHSHIVGAAPAATIVGLVFVAVVLIVVAGLMASYLTASQRANTQIAVAQAWKIRALASPLGPPAHERSPPPLTPDPTRGT
jgi:hypothetical protein